MKETTSGEITPTLVPEPQSCPCGLAVSFKLGDSLWPLSDLPGGLPGPEASSAGQLLGERRNPGQTGICDWVTPCQETGQ